VSIFTSCAVFWRFRWAIQNTNNELNCYICAGEFRGYLFTGNAWHKYKKRNGIGAGNPANWLVNSWRTRQTGFCSFDQAITGAIYFTFDDGQKSSIVQVTHQFKFFTFRFLARQKRRKQVRFEKQNWSNSSLARCQQTCLTGPLEYKYRVIFVLVLGVNCTLRSAVG